ncbi:MAG: hypothetical protein PHV68_09840 [Candidatus Gastranaerophilales bacterium]|nr:hypothetical protein [Candidatus Gastranaerophilales bacterium]
MSNYRNAYEKIKYRIGESPKNRPINKKLLCMISTIFTKIDGGCLCVLIVFWGLIKNFLINISRRRRNKMINKITRFCIKPDIKAESQKAS